MPTVTRVLVKEKTGFSPAGKKQRGDTQGCDQGTDRDLSTETEIRGLNITPFLPSIRPSAVTGSSSFLPQQVTQNDKKMCMTSWPLPGLSLILGKHVEILLLTITFIRVKASPKKWEIKY